MISDNDRKYLAQLQSDVDLFKTRLAEFEKIVTVSTSDTFLLAQFEKVRGAIRSEINQRVSDWRRYITYPGPKQLTDAEYEARVGMLKV